MKCFCCFVQDSRCTTSSSLGTSCRNCVHGYRSRLYSNKPWDYFRESDVAKQLEHLAPTTYTSNTIDTMSTHGNGSGAATLRLALVTQRFKKHDIKRDMVETNLQIGPFTLADQSPSREQLESFAWDNLRLRIKSKSVDLSSRIVMDASLAGAYLCLLFPVRTTDHGPPLLSFGSTQSQEHAKINIATLCMVRFGELLDDVVRRLRNMDPVVCAKDEAQTVMTASGLLYCELHHVTRSLLGPTELLCRDSILETVFREWIKGASSEIFGLLEGKCGALPKWDLSGSKRSLNISRIHVGLVASMTSYPSLIWNTKLSSGTSIATPRDGAISICLEEQESTALPTIEQTPRLARDESTLYTTLDPNSAVTPFLFDQDQMTGIENSQGHDFNLNCSLLEQQATLCLQEPSYAIDSELGLNSLRSPSPHNYHYEIPPLHQHSFPETLTSFIGGTEQVDVQHVSGSLPFVHGTREETSVGH